MLIPNTYVLIFLEQILGKKSQKYQLTPKIEKFTIDGKNQNLTLFFDTMISLNQFISI
jgi:hypothetical protein